MRSHYWSCSKFADWLRGTPKLKAGTREEWNSWRKSAQVKKIRFWLAEEGLDLIQNIVNLPMATIHNLRYYIDNRWISKTHALTSNLKRGQWHEFEHRLLHSAFDELVNFVEIEQAWFHLICSDEEHKKYKTPWFQRRMWRCPEAGLAYLEWAGGLMHDEEWIDKNDPDFGRPTRQAFAAQETLALYRWWKEERPRRPDPIVASGWSDYCEEKDKADKARGDDSSLDFLGRPESDEEMERSGKILDLCHKMEQEQEDEDTDMLIRLVKLRHNLWT